MGGGGEATTYFRKKYAKKIVDKLWITPFDFFLFF